jgi:hypothetical protein
MEMETQKEVFIHDRQETQKEYDRFIGTDLRNPQLALMI